MRGAAQRKGNKAHPLNLPTSADHAILRSNYTFVPPSHHPPSNDDNKVSSVSTTAATATRAAKPTWEERMVSTYHSHLYKSYVLADLTKHKTGQVGLRWRTEGEVRSGKGEESCGNKHCPSYDAAARVEEREAKELLDEYYHRLDKKRSRRRRRRKEDEDEEEEEMEREALAKIAHGVGLDDYHVHFAYVEHGVSKNELVKLKLCLRCAPLLFHRKGGAVGAREAREKTMRGGKEGQDRSSDDDESASSTSEDRRRRRRKRKDRSRRRQEQRWKGSNKRRRHGDQRKRRKTSSRRGSESSPSDEESGSSSSCSTSSSTLSRLESQSDDRRGRSHRRRKHQRREQRGDRKRGSREREPSSGRRTRGDRKRRWSGSSGRSDAIGEEEKKTNFDVISGNAEAVRNVNAPKADGLGWCIDREPSRPAGTNSGQKESGVKVLSAEEEVKAIEAEKLLFG